MLEQGDSKSVDQLQGMCSHGNFPPCSICRELSSTSAIESQNHGESVEQKDVGTEIRDLTNLRAKIADAQPVEPNSEAERLRRREELRERYKDVLAELPRVGKSLALDKYGYPTKQEITTEQVAFIRADDYQPTVEGETVKLLSSRDATQGKDWRLTKHFTLNHKVTSNNGGSWEGKPYLYIIPGEEMIAANGAPENLYAIDSFWDKSTLLPEGTVVLYEEGKYPSLPKEMSSKLKLIERKQNDDDRELAALVLEQMGYSTIEGSDHSASVAYKNFDDGIARLATQYESRSGPHDMSWSDAYEDIGPLTTQLEHPNAINRLVSLYGREGEWNEAARMPKNLKEQAWKEVFGIFNVQESDYSALSNSIEPPPTYEGDKFTTEDVGTRIKAGKDKLLNFTGKLIGGDYERGLHVIPEVDRSLMLNAIPSDAWRYQLEQMKKKIGDSLEGYKDENEVREVFEEIYGRPYQELTGKQIDI